MSNDVTPNTIWNSQQNHPELVVQDARREFGLTDEQCEKLRFILMNRGINKWLYARILFIDLKHDVKDMLKNATPKTTEYKLLQQLNTRMQNIAKMPRWVEWGTYRHNKMRNNRKDIVVKGHAQ
jgi:hypothetical protein